MYILRAFAFLFLTQAVFAQQPTPILPDPKLTPGDTFEVTAQDVCVPGYAKKVRAVPAWLKRQAYAEYGIKRMEIAIGAISIGDEILLNPVHSKFSSLASVADEAGITRACLSAALLSLKDSFGVKLCSRTETTRRNRRQAQLDSIAAGAHSSNRIRKNHNVQPTEGAKMNHESQAVFQRSIDAVTESPNSSVN
jgi:hypothetical protein